VAELPLGVLAVMGVVACENLNLLLAGMLTSTAIWQLRLLFAIGTLGPVLAMKLDDGGE
jgi:hypothetical protein